MKLFIFLAFIVATMAFYESERLLDQAIDQLELELAAKGEKDIFFQNDLDEVLFVNWSCDRQSLMSQESTWSGGLNVALEKVEVGGELSNTEKKEFTYQYMDRAFSFTKIQPNSFLEESTGLNCKRLFVDIWTIKPNGAINKFMSRSGVDEGELVIVSGTADAPLYDKTFEVCGGDKCGCKQNKCWKKCMGISKCDTQFANNFQAKQHYYRFSAPYKRWIDGGKQGDGNRVIQDARSHFLHSDEKVKCTKDRECKPSFNCKGSCTLWG